MLGDKEATHLRLIVPFVVPLSHLWYVSGFDSPGGSLPFVLLYVANVALVMKKRHLVIPGYQNSCCYHSQVMHDPLFQWA